MYKKSLKSHMNLLVLLYQLPTNSRKKILYSQSIEYNHIIEPRKIIPLLTNTEEFVK